eukprot:TRINITY_DN5429_c0_g1_i2.p1 TRINITY_DN5429_c0_g1~~TRINITY_DN5429_c0_g1_i2.p1  ORF type:complete len:179 (-),score=43.51 TRINITY_DN5429_c0_g1_i2:125-661(-)
MDQVNTKELVDYCNDMRNELLDSSSFDTIREIKSMTNTIKQNYEMKKQRDMTSLKELSQEVREMEESNSNRGFNEKRKKLLQEQRQEILTNIEKLEKEEKETELAVEEFKRKLEELNNKLVVLENESKDTIFPLRYAFEISCRRHPTGKLSIFILPSPRSNGIMKVRTSPGQFFSRTP